MALASSGKTAPAKQDEPTPKLDTSIPNFGEPLNLDPGERILLIGDTGSGKTTQIGLVSEYIFATEEKQTVLFTSDKGGILPLKPYVKAGIIVEYPYDGVSDPWIWVQHTVRGEAKVNGKWKRVTEGAGLVANEGLTAFSEMMLMNLSEHSAAHPTQAVGGESAWSFEARDGAEVMRIASNTQSHYGLVQLRIMQEIWKANQGAPSIWTAILGRSQDALMGGGILGGQTVGKAQAGSLPRWFDLTMRIDAIVREDKPTEHVLYLETHKDKLAKGAKVIANVRLPLAGASAKVDAVISPADIVKALLQIARRNATAQEDIADRIAQIRGRMKR